MWADVNYQWILGVLLASFRQAVSRSRQVAHLLLQKLLHLQRSELPESERGDYHTQTLWRIGVGLVFFGSLADFAALSFAPQSLIAPLGSLTLVSNVIFAPILLKEVIGPRDIIATIIIISGSSISVAFASHEDVTFTTDQLFGFYLRPRFLGYAAFVTCCLVGGLSLRNHLESIEALDSTVGGKYDSLRLIHRYIYPALSGTIGAQSVLFAKCTVELLMNTIRGQGSLFLHWQSYVVIFSMFMTISLQIKWLNDGLRRFSSSYTVPVFTAHWILLSVVAGLVFYEEYKGMSRLQLAMFGFGVLLTILGVVALSQRRPHESAELLSETFKVCAEGPGTPEHAPVDVRVFHSSASRRGSLKTQARPSSAQAQAQLGPGFSHSHGHASRSQPGDVGISVRAGGEGDADADADADADDADDAEFAGRAADEVPLLQLSANTSSKPRPVSRAPSTSRSIGPGPGFMMSRSDSGSHSHSLRAVPGHSLARGRT